jgi:uncharacterized membrane protein YfcA
MRESDLPAASSAVLPVSPARFRFYWASVRGWGKEERRGVFQTFNFTILATALCVQVASGLVKAEIIWLVLCAFPGTLAGAWLGARVYHALSDRNFSDVVLALLVLSGLGLLWSGIAPR